MHRPLGRATFIGDTPFRLPVARLHCTARLAARSFARLGRRTHRLGRLSFQSTTTALPPLLSCLPLRLTSQDVAAGKSKKRGLRPPCPVLNSIRGTEQKSFFILSLDFDRAVRPEQFDPELTAEGLTTEGLGRSLNSV